LIIADEVHRFGSEGLRELLPEGIKYRIGLSATPKREFDEEGTAAIFDYFCEHNEPFVIDIKQAIELEILCPYNYYPIFVELTEEELREYSTLSERIRRVMITSKDSKQNKSEKKSLTLLLKRRHRIIEQAENKISAFREQIEYLKNSESSIHKAIVYVPEGTSDGEELINHYSRILWHEFQIPNSKYVQGAKKQLLDDFKNGFIRVLLAKKRLDEGVNIPQIRQAFFISSSTVEREFVQRRGRILRKAEDKEYAEIFDFLVVPPKYFDIQLLDSDIKSIVKNELKRAESFALNAKNKYKALRLIEKEYDNL
jgi:superfamily II DNA or RNA helicase